MTSPTTKTELLKTHKEELVKQYIELDGQDRPFKVYTIRAEGANNEDCIVTQYAYKDLTSTVIIKRTEYYGKWISATMDDPALP